MANPAFKAATVDGLAISLSSLCIIHCLVLPILAVSLPIAGLWAEAEWLHKAFIIAALPLSIMALTSTRVNKVSGSLIIMGFLALAASAFVEALHDYETPLTVVGGVLLASGHGLAWRRAHGSGQA